jgi:hypothetical protein
MHSIALSLWTIQQAQAQDQDQDHYIDILASKFTELELK